MAIHVAFNPFVTVITIPRPGTRETFPDPAVATPYDGAPWPAIVGGEETHPWIRNQGTYTPHISSFENPNHCGSRRRPVRPITSGTASKSITPSEWRSTTASGASQETTSSTPNVMPARPPAAAALPVAITKVTLTCRKNNPHPASRTAEQHPHQRHNTRQGKTQERRGEVTQSLARHQVKSSRPACAFHTRSSHTRHWSTTSRIGVSGGTLSKYLCNSQLLCPAIKRSRISRSCAI